MGTPSASRRRCNWRGQRWHFRRDKVSGVTALSVNRLADGIFVCGAVTPDALARLAADGIRSIVTVRRDGETTNQHSSDDLRREAEALGLVYAHIGAAPHEITTDSFLDMAAEAFASLPRPLLAHCATGQRAAIAWAFTAAISSSVSVVIRMSNEAGFDIAALEDDITGYVSRHANERLTNHVAA